MKEWLKGKKTYLIAGGVILIAVGEFLKAGIYDLQSILDLFQSQFLPLIIMTLRAAIAKIGK